MQVIALQGVDLEKLTLKIDSSWRTPASDYCAATCGLVEITKHKERRGTYRMEGVAGYVYWENVTPVTITQIEIDGKVWMTDEPINWLGMQELAKHSTGKVLCGGLGLGLIVHALVKNEEVTEIHIAETSAHVLTLMSSIFRELHRKIIVCNCSVFDYPFLDTFDTAILDIWVGKPTAKMASEMSSASMLLKFGCGIKRVFVWGHCSKELNPAVNQRTRQLMRSAGI